jgi:bifunctional DNA-binding transcriptional regulator/antitoxin component of YhaV-PrlF toxin-antitoxin module
MLDRPFVAKVGDDGRITIAKYIRDELVIQTNDFVLVRVERLDLFRNSVHRLYDTNRSGSATARQVSITNFNVGTRGLKKGLLRPQTKKKGTLTVLKDVLKKSESEIG